MKTRFIDLRNRKTIYYIDGHINDLNKIEEMIAGDKKLQNAIKKTKGMCGIVTTQKKTLKNIIGIVEYRDINDGTDWDLEIMKESYFYVDSAEWDNKVNISKALESMYYSTKDYDNRYFRL